MSTLDEIAMAAGEPARRVLRGVTVQVRALPAAESAWARARFVRPLPPFTKDPARGSDAPMIENERDSAYIALQEEWWMRVKSLCVALACGWATKADEPAKAADKVLATITIEELDDLWLAARPALSPMVEAAAKN